jgi:putative ABC transport system permease protein
MFWNYLTVALRNIVRHKLYSFINIAGLAVGLACVIFILLFIRDELSYDKWIPDTENLYRVEKTYNGPGLAALPIANVPFPMMAAMRDSIPEVVAMTRLSYTRMTMMIGDRQFRERVASVDPAFFRTIRLPLIRGDAASVFRDPESLVLSESAARKYFGTLDVIGKSLQTTANCEGVNDTPQCRSRLMPMKVTGIVRDIPHNSQLDGEIFMPNTSIADRMGQEVKQSWFMNNSFGYVRLAPGARPLTVVAKMGPVFDRSVPGDAEFGSGYGGIRRRASQVYAIHLTPFTDVHLTSGRWRGNETPPGSWTTLYGVGVVGLLILLVACFNFMNLSTALASLRAKEIGLRKTFGAYRGQLAVQFLGEAVLTALLALVLALAMVEVLQPVFGRFLGHPICLRYVEDWPLLLGIVCIAMAAGLTSGVYPALMLSAFRPVAVLRSGTGGLAGSGRLRAFLVVLQFAVSIGLGVAVLVVFSQINFARNLDLGFRKDNLLVVAGNGLLTLGGQESFTQRLRSQPGVLELAMTGAVPFDPSLILVSAQRPGRAQSITLNRRVIGANALQIMGMRPVAGRLLSGQRAEDRFDSQMPSVDAAPNEGRNVLIDTVAASQLGFTPRQAINQTILFGKTHVRIVGVLANAKFDGAREPPRPAIYIYDPNSMGAVMVRVRPGAIPQTLSFIDHAWHDFAPTKAVNRYFLDDDFGKLYRSDEQRGELFGVFVAVAIFISCLGLFGLAAFAAGRRTKEIGIRKVFGARVRNVLVLLLWQFSIPVLLANLIAWPVSWYYLHGWLEGFAYRIALSPLYFIAAGMTALLIAWATVFFHALHVARAHPVNALRYE